MRTDGYPVRVLSNLEPESVEPECRRLRVVVLREVIEYRCKFQIQKFGLAVSLLFNFVLRLRTGQDGVTGRFFLGSWKGFLHLPQCRLGECGEEDDHKR
jgi:hypothetical protein